MKIIYDIVPLPIDGDSDCQKQLLLNPYSDSFQADLDKAIQELRDDASRIRDDAVALKLFFGEN